MKQWKNTVIPEEATIKDAVRTLEHGLLGIAMVVDVKGVLLGTITDGDIRRAILSGTPLSDAALTIMNKHPIVAHVNQDKTEIRNMMSKRHIRQIPVVDDEGRLLSLETTEDTVKPIERPNWVVLMAGGLGSRLQPLTDDCPKPLLKVGGKPLLQTILETLIAQGFRRFYFTVNYKAEMIEQYFGDGSRWDVQIRYIREDKRMGTAGSLSLLPEKPEHPFIVMNGDLLTKVNVKQLLEFHIDHQSMATMCVRDFEFQVPYGVITIDRHKLVSIQEKPTQQFFVNAGIYVLEPGTLDYIPNGQFYDMPILYESLVANQHNVSVFPIREYWLDIGRMDDYKRANSEYLEVFG